MRGQSSHLLTVELGVLSQAAPPGLQQLLLQSDLTVGQVPQHTLNRRKYLESENLLRHNKYFVSGRATITRYQIYSERSLWDAESCSLISEQICSL